MQLGFLTSDRFAPLEPGTTLWVREGVQTGKWIMPTVRVWGVSGVTKVQTRITLDDGRVAGGFTANLPFIQRDVESGVMRFDFMPIPIGTAAGGPTPEEVYGHQGMLSVTLDDMKGAPVRWSAGVRLADGDLPGAGSNGDFPAAPRSHSAGS